MSKKSWVEEVSDKYEELKFNNVLKNEVIDISQAIENEKPKEIEYKSWEKTVENIFSLYLDEKLSFSASLDDKEENYGDLIAAFKNLKWCLVEFKKTSTEISKERKKFVATSPDKYSEENGFIRGGKTLTGIETEKQAFNWLNNNFGKRKKLHFLEPHFIVFGLKNIDPDKKDIQLGVIRYWGSWSEVTNKNKRVYLEDIPEFSEIFENFVKYASLFRVAKSGDFMLAADDCGGGNSGKLEDLSIVIGIDSSKNVRCINTLDSFLKKIEKSPNHLLRNDLTLNKATPKRS